ncbi:MAG: hypothetical protein JRG92_16665 [Deltaproteobacteria bacterium]|nr:hypothetical protein [Deltaproteobacteria bacterium]
MLPGWGSVKLPGCPIRIDGTRIIPDTPPPLDADGDAIRNHRTLDER